MARVDTSDLISISEASRLGVSGLIREAEAGREQVVLRNNKPVAAVVGMERWEELQRLEEDLADVSLALARMLTTEEARHSLDDVIRHFGYTRERLAGESAKNDGSNLPRVGDTERHSRGTQRASSGPTDD